MIARGTAGGTGPSHLGPVRSRERCRPREMAPSDIGDSGLAAGVGGRVTRRGWLPKPDGRTADAPFCWAWVGCPPAGKEGQRAPASRGWLWDTLVASPVHDGPLEGHIAAYAPAHPSHRRVPECPLEVSGNVRRGHECPGDTRRRRQTRPGDMLGSAAATPSGERRCGCEHPRANYPCRLTIRQARTVSRGHPLIRCGATTMSSRVAGPDSSCLHFAWCALLDKPGGCHLRKGSSL